MLNTLEQYNAFLRYAGIDPRTGKALPKRPPRRRASDVYINALFTFRRFMAERGIAI